MTITDKQLMADKKMLYIFFLIENKHQKLKSVFKMAREFRHQHMIVYSMRDYNFFARLYKKVSA